MTARPRHGVGFRLVLPTAALAALLAGVLVVLQLREADERADESLEAYANLLSGVVLEGLREAMVADDRPRLKAQLGQYAASPAVRRVDIVAPDGRVTFSSEAGFAGSQYERSAPDCMVCHGLDRPPPTTARTVHYADETRGVATFRIVQPIEARTECLECHDEARAGQKLGILILDLDESKLVAGELRGARVLSWALAGAFALLLAAVVVVVRVVIIDRLRNVRRAVEIVRSGAMLTAPGGEAFDEIDEIERLVQCLAEDVEDRRALDRATSALEALLARAPEPVALLDLEGRLLGASPALRRQPRLLGPEGLAARPALPAPLAALLARALESGWALGDDASEPLVATVDDPGGKPQLLVLAWPAPAEGEAADGPVAELGARSDPEWRLYTATLLSGLHAEPKRWAGVLQLDRRLTSGRRLLAELAEVAAQGRAAQRDVELRTMIQVVLWEIGRQWPDVTWHALLDERHQVRGARYQLRALVRRLAEAAAAQAGTGGHAVFFTQRRPSDGRLYLGGFAPGDAAPLSLDAPGRLPLCARISAAHGGGVEVDRGFDLGPLCEARKATLPCATRGTLFVASLASGEAPKPAAPPEAPKPPGPGGSPRRGLSLVR